MNRGLYFLLISIIFAFTSCRSYKKNSTDKNTILQEENASADFMLDDLDESIYPVSRPVYRATETTLTDLIHTKLEVNFDWPNARMNGIATITAKPHFYASDSLVLDAKGMEILSVSLNNQALAYSYVNDFLHIKLNKEYKRTENYTIQINYIAKPNDRITKGSAAILEDKGLYFINPKGDNKFKMPQIWTQGETESNSAWFPTIDSPNAKTTEEIFITVDQKYTTLSNGKLISSKVNSNGSRTDHWKQDLPHAPYLFMMAVGEFKQVKDYYTRPDGSKIEVNYYVEPEWESVAKDIFGETPKMIKYFSQLLGVEYAWDKYSQIVVREYVSGAMENTGAVVFGDYVYKTKRELLDENDQSTIAHELFHHWFGDLVTCESWSNLTLNESFANYSQYLWDEHRFGSDEAAYRAEIEADGYYESAQDKGYHDLVWFEFDDKEEMFDGHSYNKGGRILHMLRSYLGDDAFFKGLTLYLTTNKFKSAEYSQLRLSFEEVSGEDLNWFFDQWYLGSAHPILDIKQSQNKTDKTVKISIEQSQNLDLSPIFKLPLQIAVFDSLGKHIHKVLVDSLINEFTLPYDGTLGCVIVDDQQMLLAKIREEKPLDQYVYQYYNGKTYKARKIGLSEGIKLNNSQSEQMNIDALKDPFWEIRSVAIAQANKLKDQNKIAAIEIIKTLAIADSTSQVRADALSFLAKNLEDEVFVELLLEAMKKEQSYLVLSTALSNLGQINPKLALVEAKKLENESSTLTLDVIGQIYSAHGTTDDYAFFEKTLKGNNLKGYDKISVMNSFALYSTKLDVDVNEKAFELFVYLKENGDQYTKMFYGKFIAYYMKTFSEKIEELKVVVDENEKNKDVVYANQGRKKIQQYEALSLKFSTLLDEKIEEGIKEHR